MQFAFNLWNHNEMGRRSLEDPMGIIGHQLRDLGHRVVWLKNDDEFLAGDSGINVVIEGFTPFATAKIAAAYAQSARFVCVATEEPTPNGFNHGRDDEMVKRQAEFPNAAKYFDGILYLVPGDHVQQWYGQFAPAAYVELGYAPTLVRAFDWQEPQYDFGFFGSLSKRRHKILKKLAKAIGSE